jgi:hypothetical protein
MQLQQIIIVSLQSAEERGRSEIAYVIGDRGHILTGCCPNPFLECKVSKKTGFIIILLNINNYYTF